MCVSIGGQHFKDSIVDGQKGHVEGSSPEVEYQNVALASGLVHTVRNGGGRGFVDDAVDLESTDGTCILGGLTLGVVEVCGDGYHGIVHLLS
mmetsp:Transcript_824/g.1306  ORF Transcript_824/g.1306 Transcript_824/m.1306 type:complete len:92 (-) Transcript_824:185-460(-)